MNTNLKFKSKMTLYDLLSLLENEEIEINLQAQTSIGGKPLVTHIGLYYFKRKDGCEVLKSGLAPLIIEEVETRKYIVESYKITTNGIGDDTLKERMIITIKDNPDTVERNDGNNVLKNMGSDIQSVTKRGIEKAKSTFESLK